MNKEAWKGLIGIAQLWREETQTVDFLNKVQQGFVEDGSDELNRSLISLSSQGGFFDTYPLLVDTWSQAAYALPYKRPVGDDLIQFVKPFLPLQDRALGLIFWLRSRIPGFPKLYPIGLAKGAPLNSPDLSLQLPWPPLKVIAGLQFESTPPWHFFDVEQAKRYRLHASSLLKDLEDHALWNEFTVLSNNLSEYDIDSLKAARRRITSELSNDRVDMAEPERMMNRMRFRQKAVDAEMNNLTEPAREYSQSFEKLNAFITDISQTILGWMILGNQPTKITHYEALSIFPDGTITFDTEEFGSKLAYIESPLTPHVFRVQEQTLYSDQLHNITVQTKGVPIPFFPRRYLLE